jgi:hydrogenase accessory protein HypB
LRSPGKSPPERPVISRRRWCSARSRAGELSELDFLFIENVGNLVCPASYDLGEALRIVALSVTEGEDEPLKYPTIFNSADVAVITKVGRASVQ